LARPAVCVTFRNTATQEVKFDIEMLSGTGVGVGRPPGSTVGCLIVDSGPPSYFQCTAADNMIGGDATTRAAPSSWLLWANAWAAVPFFGQTAALPMLQKQWERLAETDPEWQGFYVSGLDWDTLYCVRVRARDTSDTVSELWSARVCARTPTEPPVPGSPTVKVEFNELRGVLYASWEGSVRVGYYTVEGGASLNKYAPEVARLVPQPAREPSMIKPFKEQKLELAVPYGLAKAMDGEAYLLRVCAHNVTGKSCSEWASSLGTGTPRSIANASAADTGGVADVRPPPDPAAASTVDRGGLDGAVTPPPNPAAAQSADTSGVAGAGAPAPAASRPVDRSGGTTKSKPIRRDKAVAIQP
jgi:hypothetical protein